MNPGNVRSKYSSGISERKGSGNAPRPLWLLILDLLARYSFITGGTQDSNYRTAKDNQWETMESRRSARMLKNGKRCSSFQHRKKMDLLSYGSECLTKEKKKILRYFLHECLNTGEWTTWWPARTASLQTYCKCYHFLFCYYLLHVLYHSYVDKQEVVYIVLH